MTASIIPPIVEVAKILPLGPWPGDERLRDELAKLSFVRAILRSFGLSIGPNNKFKTFANKHNLERYSEVVTNVDAAVDFLSLSRSEQNEFTLHMRAFRSDFAEMLAPLDMNPHKLITRLVAQKLGNSDVSDSPALPRGVVALLLLGDLSHFLVANAINRIFPQYPWLSHVVNWSIIVEQHIYISSYSNADGDTVNDRGERVSSDEVTAMIKSDPRVAMETVPKNSEEAIDDMKVNPHRYYVI